MRINKIQVYCGDCGYVISTGEKDRSDVPNLFKTVCPGCGGNADMPNSKSIQWKSRKVKLEYR